MRLVVVAAFVLAVSGCAHRTQTAQTLVTPAAVDHGDGVATYHLSDGQVRVAMLPMVQIPALWLGQRATKALHVRVTFDNVGLHEWTVYPRDQVARVERRANRPEAAALDPLVIAPGETRSLDLYYAAPVLKNGDALPSAVSLDWHIVTPGVLVAGNAQINPAVALSPRERF